MATTAPRPNGYCTEQSEVDECIQPVSEAASTSKEWSMPFSCPYIKHHKLECLNLEAYTKVQADHLVDTCVDSGESSSLATVCNSLASPNKRVTYLSTYKLHQGDPTYCHEQHCQPCHLQSTAKREQCGSGEITIQVLEPPIKNGGSESHDLPTYLTDSLTSHTNKSCNALEVSEALKCNTSESSDEVDKKEDKIDESEDLGLSCLFDKDTRETQPEGDILEEQNISLDTEKTIEASPSHKQGRTQDCILSILLKELEEENVQENEESETKNNKVEEHSASHHDGISDTVVEFSLTQSNFLEVMLDKVANHMGTSIDLKRDQSHQSIQPEANVKYITCANGQTHLEEEFPSSSGIFAPSPQQAVGIEPMDSIFDNCQLVETESSLFPHCSDCLDSAPSQEDSIAPEDIPKDMEDMSSHLTQKEEPVAPEGMAKDVEEMDSRRDQETRVPGDVDVDLTATISEALPTCNLIQSPPKESMAVHNFGPSIQRVMGDGLIKIVPSYARSKLSKTEYSSRFKHVHPSFIMDLGQTETTGLGPELEGAPRKIVFLSGEAKRLGDCKGHGQSHEKLDQGVAESTWTNLKKFTLFPASQDGDTLDKMRLLNMATRMWQSLLVKHVNPVKHRLSLLPSVDNAGMLAAQVHSACQRFISPTISFPPMTPWKSASRLGIISKVAPNPSSMLPLQKSDGHTTATTAGEHHPRLDNRSHSDVAVSISSVAPPVRSKSAPRRPLITQRRRRSRKSPNTQRLEAVIKENLPVELEVSCIGDNITTAQTTEGDEGDEVKSTQIAKGISGSNTSKGRSSGLGDNIRSGMSTGGVKAKTNRTNVRTSNLNARNGQATRGIISKQKKTSRQIMAASEMDGTLNKVYPNNPARPLIRKNNRNMNKTSQMIRVVRVTSYSHKNLQHSNVHIGQTNINANKPKAELKTLKRHSEGTPRMSISPTEARQKDVQGKFKTRLSLQAEQETNRKKILKRRRIFLSELMNCHNSDVPPRHSLWETLPLARNHVLRTILGGDHSVLSESVGTEHRSTLNPLSSGYEGRQRSMSFDSAPSSTGKSSAPKASYWENVTMVSIANDAGNMMRRLSKNITDNVRIAKRRRQGITDAEYDSDSVDEKSFQSVMWGDQSSSEENPPESVPNSAAVSVKDDMDTKSQWSTLFGFKDKAQAEKVAPEKDRAETAPNSIREGGELPNECVKQDKLGGSEGRHDPTGNGQTCKDCAQKKKFNFQPGDPCGKFTIYTRFEDRPPAEHDALSSCEKTKGAGNDPLAKMRDPNSTAAQQKSHGNKSRVVNSSANEGKRQQPKLPDALGAKQKSAYQIPLNMCSKIGNRGEIGDHKTVSNNTKLDMVPGKVSICCGHRMNSITQDLLKEPVCKVCGRQFVQGDMSEPNLGKGTAPGAASIASMRRNFCEIGRQLCEPSSLHLNAEMRIKSVMERYNIRTTGYAFRTCGIYSESRGCGNSLREWDGHRIKSWRKHPSPCLPADLTLARRPTDWAVLKTLRVDSSAAPGQKREAKTVPSCGGNKSVEANNKNLSVPPKVLPHRNRQEATTSQPEKVITDPASQAIVLKTKGVEQPRISRDGNKGNIFRLCDGPHKTPFHWERRRVVEYPFLCRSDGIIKEKATSILQQTYKNEDGKKGGERKEKGGEERENKKAESKNSAVPSKHNIPHSKVHDPTGGSEAKQGSALKANQEPREITPSNPVVGGLQEMKTSIHAEKVSSKRKEVNPTNVLGVPCRNCPVSTSWYASGDFGAWSRFNSVLAPKKLWTKCAGADIAADVYSYHTNRFDFSSLSTKPSQYKYDFTMCAVKQRYRPRSVCGKRDSFAPLSSLSYITDFEKSEAKQTSPERTGTTKSSGRGKPTSPCYAPFPSTHLEQRGATQNKGPDKCPCSTSPRSNTRRKTSPATRNPRLNRHAIDTQERSQTKPSSTTERARDEIGTGERSEPMCKRASRYVQHANETEGWLTKKCNLTHRCAPHPKGTQERPESKFTSDIRRLLYANGIHEKSETKYKRNARRVDANDTHQRSLENKPISTTRRVQFEDDTHRRPNTATKPTTRRDRYANSHSQNQKFLRRNYGLKGPNCSCSCFHLSASCHNVNPNCGLQCDKNSVHEADTEIAICQDAVTQTRSDERLGLPTDEERMYCHRLIRDIMSSPVPGVNITSHSIPSPGYMDKPSTTDCRNPSFNRPLFQTDLGRTAYRSGLSHRRAYSYWLS